MVKPERIILFGSQARGDATPDSDIDLVVVMPVTGSRREMRLQIGLCLFSFRAPVDVVVVTPQEYVTDVRWPGTIVRPAVCEEQVRLTDYATVTRYPGDYEPPSLADARAAVKIARRVRGQVRKRLPKRALK